MRLLETLLQTTVEWYCDQFGTTPGDVWQMIQAIAKDRT